MDIKGLFWKSDKKSPENDGTPTQVQTPPQSMHSAPNTPPVSNEDFNMFCQQLYDALDAANMPGQDYMDLRQALKNMSNLSMTEETKFQAIFATMATAGADSESFIKSFNYYKDVLSNEKQKFDEAIESAISDSIHAKQADVEKLTDANTKNAAEIKRLTEEISANNKQITALQIEISNANSKIEQKKQNFEAAFQKVEKEIDDDCIKSQKYINILPTAPTQQTKTSTRKSFRKEK